MIFLLSILVILLIYSLTVLLAVLGWRKLDYNQSSEKQTKKLKASVVVTIKNEEKNLEKLINDLSNQTYPKELLEVIIVDDHSNDKSLSIGKHYESIYPWLKVYSNTSGIHGKKAAHH